MLPSFWSVKWRITSAGASQQIKTTNVVYLLANTIVRRRTRCRNQLHMGHMDTKRDLPVLRDQLVLWKEDSSESYERKGNGNFQMNQYSYVTNKQQLKTIIQNWLEEVWYWEIVKRFPSLLRDMFESLLLNLKFFQNFLQFTRKLGANMT